MSMHPTDVVIDAAEAAANRERGWWRDATVYDDVVADAARHPDNVAMTVALDDLTHHLQGERMTKQYWLERLELRDPLPKTASGKIQKFVLRHELRTHQPANTESGGWDCEEVSV